jgi:16S rRNA (adenine1518-N6/adenine1519-N6)-dimethyltransferase
MGQHFLHDARIARAIVEALPADPARVVEIGPGPGALTRPLLERYPRVRVVELDERLARALPTRLNNPAGLEVIAGDALVVDLQALASGGPWLWAGNLPYSVATPIVRRLVERSDCVAAAVVMVQLEVAARLVAGAGETERGFFSVVVETAFRAELLFTVPARCFSPPPQVTSAVVRLLPRPAPAPPEVVARALELAGGAFTHRRKKLANAISVTASPGEVSGRLLESGLDPSMRPQELALEGWLAVARVFPAPGER